MTDLKIDVREWVSELWISVDRGLPNQDAEYLCYLKGIFNDHYMKVVRFTSNLEHIDEDDFRGKSRPGFFGYDSEYGYFEEKVLYWMPLPYAPMEK